MMIIRAIKSLYLSWIWMKKKNSSNKWIRLHMDTFDYRKHKVFWIQNKTAKEKKGNAQNEVFVRQSIVHVRFITDESLAKSQPVYSLMTLHVVHKKWNWSEKNIN